MSQLLQLMMLLLLVLFLLGKSDGDSNSLMESDGDSNSDNSFVTSVYCIKSPSRE